MDTEVFRFMAVAVIGSVGLAMPAWALAKIGKAALDGIARNPEAQKPIFTNMILIAGLAEAVAIYALILGIIVTMIM